MGRAPGAAHCSFVVHQFVISSREDRQRLVRIHHGMHDDTRSMRAGEQVDGGSEDDDRHPDVGRRCSRGEPLQHRRDSPAGRFVNKPLAAVVVQHTQAVDGHSPQEQMEWKELLLQEACAWGENLVVEMALLRHSRAAYCSWVGTRFQQKCCTACPAEPLAVWRNRVVCESMVRQKLFRGERHDDGSKAFSGCLWCGGNVAFAYTRAGTRHSSCTVRPIRG